MTSGLMHLRESGAAVEGFVNDFFFFKAGTRDDVRFIGGNGRRGGEETLAIRIWC